MKKTKTPLPPTFPKKDRNKVTAKGKEQKRVIVTPKKKK